MVLMTIFLFAPPYIPFSLGESSDYYSSVIFKRLTKDREQLEEKKVKSRDRSESEIKKWRKKLKKVINDAYIPDAF